MSVTIPQPDTPPKDLEQILLQYHAEQRQGLNELAGRGNADEQLKAALTAWSDQRTLAIIGEDELLQVYKHRGFADLTETSLNESITNVKINARNKLRIEQRKALKADGGGDERS